MEQILQKCLSEKQYKYALGIAIEARLLDKIEQVLALDRNDSLNNNNSNNNNNNNELLNYLFDISMNVITKRKFRMDMLRLIAKNYESHEKGP